jgi:O-antigen/teichoic acid export membrane protein
MWHSLARNALANVGGTLVGLVVGFVTMPLVVHHLGPTQFGLWVLATGIVGYVGVLDLGLAPTLVNEAASLLVHDAPEARRRLGETASTIFALYGALGALAGLGLVAVGAVAGSLFHVAADDLATFRGVLLVIGLQTALGLPMSVWNGLLSGLQAFHVVNAIGAATTLARGVLTVALVLAGYGLVALVTASFAVTCLAWTASWWCVRRRVPGLRVRIGGFRRTRLREIGRFSAAMVVWTLAGAALHQLDRVLIGVVLPVASLTTYEVGARLANYSRAVLHSWLSIVMPATSAMVARGERRRLRALYLRSTRYLLVSYGGVALALTGLGAPLVRLWMGDGFADGYAVMALLVAGSLVQSQTVVAHVMLPAMGEIRVFTRFMAVYPVVTATCAIAGILAGGLVGLAAGTTCSIVVMETAFLALIVRTRFDVAIARVLRRCHLPAVKALLPAATVIVAARAMTPIASWAALVGAALLAGLAFVAGAWRFGLTPAERRAIRDRLAGLRAPQASPEIVRGPIGDAAGSAGRTEAA